MPQISVIIPVYNSKKYLSETIDSVLSQTYQDFEMIIVDDGSIDNTSSVINNFIRVNPSFLIRYICQNNAGPSAARNRGIKESQGKYVAFLDSDDIWEQDKLVKQIGYMIKNNLKGLCCTDYNFADESGIAIGTHRLSHRSKTKALEALFIKNVVSTCSTVMINRECFNAVGLFDESLHVAEDWDMWIRIIRKFDFAHIPEPLVKVRGRSNSQSSDGKINIDNEIRFLKKLFNKNGYKKSYLLKRKSFAYRYFCAAWAFYDSKDTKTAKKYIFKSLFMYPFPIKDGELGRYKLFIKLLFI